MSRASRRKGREAALQLLYQIEVTGEDGSRGFESYWRSWPDGDQDEATREFAEELVGCVLREQARIDALIDTAAHHWDIDRFSRVDRNLLRLAVGEMVGPLATPAPVAINEAVEIARRFSDEKAAGFINGVLDRVARDLGCVPPRPDAAPRAAAGRGKKA